MRNLVQNTTEILTLCIRRQNVCSVVLTGIRRSRDVSLGQRLRERGFICNRIVFDAVAPSVYTTPIETVAETVSIGQKWSVFKTMRFHLSCKQ